LLQLTGLIWLCRFAVLNLLHRKDREHFFADLNRSWSSRSQDG
jgi:hypothetical protein